MRPAAFFDMDQTVLRVNSGTLWMKYLRRRGEITRFEMARAMGWAIQYKLAILDMAAKRYKRLLVESRPEFVTQERVKPLLGRGIEFEIAEIGSASTHATGKIRLDLNNTYGQFNILRHSGKGVVRARASTTT